jgi:hypothetical protein
MRRSGPGIDDVRPNLQLRSWTCSCRGVHWPAREPGRPKRPIRLLPLPSSPNPASISSALFQSEGKVSPFYYQGALRVDQSTFDAVMLPTDLLDALPDLYLTQLPTELSFRLVHIQDSEAESWLPNELSISSDQGAGPAEENHRYSDYPLYHSSARIVPPPSNTSFPKFSIEKVRWWHFRTCGHSRSDYFSAPCLNCWDCQRSFRPRLILAARLSNEFRTGEIDLNAACPLEAI